MGKPNQGERAAGGPRPDPVTKSVELIKAEANNGSFHVSVRDTGPGISAADQANLFQEFQQADNAITC